jgi:hypothetical protein
MNTKFIDDLSLRIYDDLGEKFIRDYLTNGLPLPDEKELAYYITNAMGIYVSPDEQKQYLLDNLGDFADEDVNSLMIRIAIRIATLNVRMRIRKELTNKNLIIENSLSELDDPKEFIPKE